MSCFARLPESRSQHACRAMNLPLANDTRRLGELTRIIGLDMHANVEASQLGTTDGVLFAEVMQLMLPKWMRYLE